MTRRPRRTRLATVSLGLAVALVVSGCSGGSGASSVAGADTGADAVGSDEGPDTEASATPAPSPPPGRGDVQYVALGDSYAAAPGVPETDAGDPCFRSDSNYAHVLAEAEDLYLTDVTCSGADSDQILAEQVPLLGPETDLVTIGTGGNDFDLFVTALTGCLSRPGAEPADPAVPSPCAEVIDTRLAPLADQIQAKMGEVLDAITAAAPRAEVYVVGYPALLPRSGRTCPDLVPIAAADYPLVAELTRSLSQSLRAEATARDLPFVDVYAASRDHDICADEPWVNGAQVAEDGTIPFHPFGIEQEAVAALIGDLR